MICIQDDMCYNKGEEILSLSNEQAEYVLRRMLETNE